MLARTSKHATKFGEGRVRIFRDSSLRKLMRAARRGVMPPERQQIIDQAGTITTVRRITRYMHSSEKRRLRADLELLR